MRRTQLLKVYKTFKIYILQATSKVHKVYFEITNSLILVQFGSHRCSGMGGLQYVWEAECILFFVNE